MKKIIIIGGGIAGLSAGIYALKNGFDVCIHEKNAVMGGECTGWNRHGYHIDNCIHWLTGCAPKDDMYKIWQEIGAIDNSTEFYREDAFYSLETGDRTLHFWRDINKAREEFLETSPEDREEIIKFFDGVKRAESVKVSCEKSLARMNFLEYMKFGMSMAEMGKVIKEYGNDTVADLAARFKDPRIRQMMMCYMNPSYKALPLISSYAFYTGGTAAIPMGGSTGMVKRIVGRFTEMGGKIVLNSAAVKINIDNGIASSVSFADGSTESCDHVICACDPAVTFGKLIDRKYMDKNLKKMYENGYTVTSTFNVSFGIDGEGDCGINGGSIVFPCEKFTAGKQENNYMGVRLYDYDPLLFPKNKRVIQCNIVQDSEDYEYWKNIYNDREKYSEEKQRIAEEVKARITAHFPKLEGRLILLDTYSPMTFTKWCGAYKGAYMSFFEQKGYKSLTEKNSIKGLDNVYIASQWLTTNGGLPIAAASGKFAVMDIMGK